MSQREERSYIVRTFGCQMNDHDGEKLTGLMLRDGYEEVRSSKEADIVLLNTCSIREKAVHKVFSELGRLKKEKFLISKSPTFGRFYGFRNCL